MRAVITGATGGMGKEICRLLGEDHTIYPIGRSATPPHDLHSLSTPEHLLELDRIDVLIHAAAIATPLRVDTATNEDWLEQLRLNVIAPAALTRDLLPALRAAEGTVIFINSGAGHGAHPGNTVYAATKHALHALADGLRKEEPGIRVATVSPGPTDTAMLRDMVAAQGGTYTPEHYITPVEVAKAVRMVVDAGPSTQITQVDVRPRIELADRSTNS